MSRGEDPGLKGGQALERELADLRGALARLRERIAHRFTGQEQALEQLLWALLAGGHALIEGAPGLGKTTLVRALADGLDLSFGRVQCTPDLMPSDVLGARVLEEDGRGARSFRFERGPVFTHVLLADEINRATPRTQSALLEAMAERQVTVFGQTLALDEPFLVVATQNPIEMEGTYPLPEAQLDRFLLKLEIRAPQLPQLVEILVGADAPARESGAVLERARLLRLIELVRGVPVAREVVELAARIVRATHPDDALAGPRVKAGVRYGASPRGGLALLAASRARALTADRPWVGPDDLLAVAHCALRHRLILSYEAEAGGTRPEALIDEAVARAREAG